MAQKKPAAKKAATKKTSAKRARNSDGTYKGDDKSTPDVNESVEKPKAATKPGTKATTKPRNPVAKQREAATPKKPATKKAPVQKTAAKKPAPKKHTYAPKVTQETKPATPTKPSIEELWRTTPTTQIKKSRVARMWSWLVGE